MSGSVLLLSKGKTLAIVRGKKLWGGCSPNVEIDYSLAKATHTERLLRLETLPAMLAHADYAVSHVQAESVHALECFYATGARLQRRKRC